MRSEIHPLVMATIENERARRELELERLRSAREACVTSSAGGQNRALSLGKRIRQLEEITGSWRLVLATVLGAMDEMTQAAEKPRVVGARTTMGRVRCVPCTQDFRTLNPHSRALTDVTAEDLPEGKVCVGCGKDVLA